MQHDHDHRGHSHGADVNQRNQRAFVIGICLNLAFVLAEVVAGLLYRSVALLTDAGHNLSDVASLVLSLVAFWMARKQSTAVYTYGYKKTTVLAALVNSVILLIAIGILGYEAMTRLFDPKPVEGGVVAWVAAAGIVVNTISAFLFYRNKESDLNVKGAYLHLLADALVSVGVVIAGVVMTYTGWYWLDPMIGLVIMVVIIISTWNLLRDSFKMSIDAVPAGIDLAKVKETIQKVAHVERVEHVHIWAMSTTENALTAHLFVNCGLTFEEKLKVVNDVKHELMHCDIQHATIELQQ